MTNELKQYFDDTFSVLTGNKNKVDDELLKDNDHTFTLKTGTRDDKGLRNKVLIFSTKSEKYDLDKIEAYKANKENIEVVHNIISPKAMEILSKYMQVQEEVYDDVAGLLAEYEAEEYK